jgi:hypothetical protein
MPQLIDLAQNRLLAIYQDDRRYSLTVPPIPPAVWFESFFETITAFVRREGNEIEKHVDVHSAGVNLIEKTAIAAEGYPHLVGVPEWQSKLPLKHRIRFGGLLLMALELDDKAPPASTLRGTCAVRLQALWSASATGAMCRHRNLVHHFKAPSIEQKGRFHRADTGYTRSVDASRRGGSILLAPVRGAVERTLATLYDELILRVEGYAANGEPLSDNRSAIIERMDTFHKYAAARPLFSWSAAQVKAWRRPA